MESEALKLYRFTSKIYTHSYAYVEWSTKKKEGQGEPRVYMCVHGLSRSSRYPTFILPQLYLNLLSFISTFFFSFLISLSPSSTSPSPSFLTTNTETLILLLRRSLRRVREETRIAEWCV